MVAAFHAYARFVTVEDDELPVMKFLEARLYWRRDLVDKSIPLFVEILRKHRSSETAAPAADLLLDTLLRLKRGGDVRKWASWILANEKKFEVHEELLKRAQKLVKGTRRKSEGSR